MTYKGVEIGNEPTFEMLYEFTEKMGYDIDVSAIYNDYVSRGWLTRKHQPVKSVEAILAAANGIEIERKRKLGLISTVKKKRIPDIPNDDPSKSQKENYFDFLNSDYWKYVRHLKLKKAGNKCQICSKKENLYVKHNSFAHYKEEHKNLGDLIVICKECYAKLKRED